MRFTLPIVLACTSLVFGLCVERTRSAGVSGAEAAVNDKVAKAVNIDLDKDSALRIAEVVLIKVYGKTVLQQRPWKITAKDGSYEIVGTFHGGDFAVGGVATIRIRKSNGEVTAISHGK